MEKRCWYWLGMMGLAGALNTCTAKLDSLVMDPIFTSDVLENGYIVMADVVYDEAAEARRRDDKGAVKDDSGVPAGVSDAEARVLAQVLVDAVVKERPEVKTQLLAAHPRMSDKLRDKLRDAMKRGRTIEPELMFEVGETLRVFPHPFRYLAQARIEGERTSRQRSENTETRKESTGKRDAKGNWINVDVEYVVQRAESVRALDIRLLIVDLRERKVVFDGLATQNVTRVASDEERLDRSLGIRILQSVTRRAIDYPAWPERRDVFVEAAPRFAVALPTE